MKITPQQLRPFGATGLVVPPIAFNAGVLGNVDRVIPDATKLAICGEWFQRVSPPVFIEASYHQGEGRSLEVLGRLLRRLGVSADEVLIHLELDDDQSNWEKSCRLLGDEYRPQLVSVSGSSDETWQVAEELKEQGEVAAIGLRVAEPLELDQSFRPVDWIKWTGHFSLLQHPPDVLERMANLADRQVPIVMADPLAGGFLTGGPQLDGRTLAGDDPSDRSLLAWRRAFIALCHGHGVSPEQAAIQFALAAPGVAAVSIDAAHSQRVAEVVRAVCQNVPPAFWLSLKEEGLLAADDSHLP